MDNHRFDSLVKTFSACDGSRRSLLQALGGGALAALVGRLQDPAAEAKKKRKRNKRRCPKSRRCGKNNGRCCKKGQLCSGGRCVTGQGSCPAGANFCFDGTTTCNGNPNCVCLEQKAGGTRCGFTITAQHECGECDDDADCVAKFGGAAFCILGGPSCGCQPGEGTCVTACPD